MTRTLMAWRHAAVGLVLVAMAGLGSGCGESETGGSGSSADDSKLAKVDLTPVAGAEKLVLGEATPLPLVVNLWATWCPPCRKELPDFQKVSDERKDAVRFVGVNVGEDEASASKFVESVGVTFDQYVDENSELQTALDVTGMPSTAFFAKDGTLVDVVSGAISRKDLETKIDTLFQEELVDE